MELLLKSGAALDGIRGERTPLHCAVYSRHPATVALLPKNKADPNRADRYGTMPLACAAGNGDFASVRMLLDAGGDFEAADEYGWRPLHTALRSTGCSDANRLATVGILPDCGADPNAENAGGFQRDGEHDSHLGFRLATLPNEGNRPVTIAKSNDFTEIVELLKARGGR